MENKRRPGIDRDHVNRQTDIHKNHPSNSRYDNPGAMHDEKARKDWQRIEHEREVRERRSKW